LPAYLTNVNGTLFFSADDGSAGQELWESDGTTAGTVLVKDIVPGSVGSQPTALTNVNGTLFFSARSDTNRRQLWKSAGTAADTLLVKEGFSGQDDVYGQSAPFALINVGGTLFFTNASSSGTELWRSDGTAAGTILLKVTPPGMYNMATMGQLTAVNQTLFFSASPDHLVHSELWKSDGTPAGTVLVTTMNANELTTARGLLFYINETPGLWKSDGTTAGTLLVKDINPGSAYSNPLWMSDVDGTVFFSADDGAGVALWKSDGTPDGTQRILAITTWSSPLGLNVQGMLFFRQAADNNTRELWRSDGTEAGTVQVKDSALGFGGAIPTGLVNANGTLVFSAWDLSHGVEPWMSDGTAAGTLRIQDIAPGNTSSNPSQFYVSDNTLFFTANDGATGQELWALPMAAIHPVAASIAPDGGQLISLLDSTSYTFPAGSFTAATTVAHRVRAPDSLPAVGTLASINHVFEVTAVDSATSRPVQPARPYTLTVHYTEAERGSAIESTLALYSWDGSRWEREPNSVIDATSMTITATPNHFSIWAVLGDSHRAFLPVVSRSR
jgi:ELWxxDGT repeat protein